MSDAARQRFLRLVDLIKTGALDDADQAIATALRTTPKEPNILHLGAQVAQSLGDRVRAEKLYKRALAARPHWFEVGINLALLLAGDRNYDEATALLLKLGPHHPKRTEIPRALASFAQAQGRWKDAIPFWQAVLRLAPDHEALCAMHFCKRQIGLWDEPLPLPNADFAPRWTAIFYDDPALQKESAQRYCTKAFGKVPVLPPPEKYFHERCRIGYLSSDFHAHPTSWLIAELFTLHDRSKFEVYAYSYGIEDHSPIRQRLRDETDHFIELQSLTPAACAQRIRDDEIDILVDLKGHTQGARLDILAMRPAPYQVHWLGFPATTGAPFIDAFIADSHTVPPGSEPAFSEKILRLPHCYQINDREKEIATPKSKSEYGLPEESLVLACFNQSYKITPEMFALWCDILREEPSAILWLYESNADLPFHLCQEAQKNGIDTARFFFAQKLPMAEHLARYSVVDVALDTFPVGGHTTTSDALWGGALVVTMAGRSFVSRVAASLLHAVRMGNLVTTTPEAYRQTVLDLLRDPKRREDLRHNLRIRRKTLPLFDTPLFVNAFEKLLLEEI